jgi:hypothetical protein
MNVKYEYYGTYSEDASGDVNLEGQLRDFLWTMELMFDYVEKKKPEIRDAFLEKVKEKYATELENSSHVLENVGFDRIAKEQTLLGSYPDFKDLGLKIIMKYIPLKEGHVLNEEPIKMRWIDYCRAKYRLLYHRITTLVDILGRESGIQFYKEFVEHWGKEIAKKRKLTQTYPEVRENYVKSWKEGNAMEFGVVDIDDAAFLAKFDRCVSHESMKDVDDQELAYYAVCYPGEAVGRYIQENVLLRRSVTLFTGTFCDELRWDRHIHDEPEQPSQDFSRKIVRK